MARPWPIRALLVAVVSAVAAACGRTPAVPAAASEGTARIVSLSPALTRSVCMLGGQSAVVGRTPWCDAPGAQVVGSLEDRDLEAIAALRPSLVLRQSSVDDPALDEVAASVGATVRTWHLDGVDDVRAGLEALARLLGANGIAGAEAAARDLLDRHRHAVGVPVRTTAPVLFLFSTDPPMAFGAGTFVDDLWRRMGGANAVSVPGYPTLSAEDVVRMRPAAVVAIGSGSMPSWLSGASGTRVRIDAPDLLEPSARMLVDGPSSLRRADDAIVAAGAGR